MYSANQYKLREKGILDNTTMVEFSVKFYYTQAFGREVAEKELFFDNVSKYIQLSPNFKYNIQWN